MKPPNSPEQQLQYSSKMPSETRANTESAATDHQKSKMISFISTTATTVPSILISILTYLNYLTSARTRTASIQTLFVLFLCLLVASGECGTIKPTCRVVGHEELIDVPGCLLVVVKINKCSGYCSSFSFFHPIDNNKLTMLAKCCRMTGMKNVEVNLDCEEGVRKMYIPSASECSCYDCGVDRM